MAPVFVPAVCPAGFTLTVRFAGALPLVGATLSHDWFELAVYDIAPLPVEPMSGSETDKAPQPKEPGNEPTDDKAPLPQEPGSEPTDDKAPVVTEPTLGWVIIGPAVFKLEPGSYKK